MGIMDKVKDTVGAITSTADEYKNLGKEYQAKADQVAPKPAPATAPARTTTPSGKPPRRYGDAEGQKKGEQRLNVSDYLKPLASFEKGTSHVPKTGVYKLHEGEAVIPKDKNTMNAADAMAGITGKSAKPAKKIHKITTHKTDDGKMIHTHQHHHPAHHPDETHVSNNMDEANAHMTAAEPEMSAQPPAMPEAAPAGPTPGM